MDAVTTSLRILAASQMLLDRNGRASAIDRVSIMRAATTSRHFLATASVWKHPPEIGEE
jgi:hypothetical protein